MALSEADIDPALIADTRAVVATGTHLSHPRTEAAVLKALRLARATGARTALDIDYRPNLWGLAGHGLGEERYIESAAVTAKLQSTLHLFDLIVGTEEEFHIAGGTTDTLAALRAVRAVSPATLVCKRGAQGAAAFTGPIPASLDDGEKGPGFPIEVFNVLGAGDGFMSGLLKGWLTGQDWPTALKYANACGAFAVSRHGCTPAYPSWEELQLLPRTAASAPPPCATTPSSSRSTGPPTACATGPSSASSPSTTACSSKRSPTKPASPATASAPSSASASMPPARSPPAAPATASSATAASAATRSTPPPAPASGSAARSRTPAPAPSASRSSPTTAPPSPNGRSSTWSRSSASATPTTTPAMQADQEATLVRLFRATRANRLELLLEIIPSKVAAT